MEIKLKLILGWITMNKQIKRKIDNLERDKQNLAKKEEDLKELIDTWEYFNSDNSKKYLNLPTMNELLEYEGRVFDENDNILPNYKNLDYDLTYFSFILKEIAKYDFFVPCRLLTRKKIKPDDVLDMKVSDGYIEFIQSLYDRLEQQ